MTNKNGSLIPAVAYFRKHVNGGLAVLVVLLSVGGGIMVNKLMSKTAGLEAAVKHQARDIEEMRSFLVREFKAGGEIVAVDKKSITILDDNLKENTYYWGQDAEVTIDGNHAKIGDLKKGMEVYRIADKTVTLVRASTPKEKKE